MVFPYPLLFYYGYDQVQIANFKSLQFYISLSIIIGIVVGIIFLYKKYPVLSFALAFLLLNLIPYTNLMSPVAGVVAERLTFVSSLGFCMLIAFFANSFLQKKKYKNLNLIFLSLFIVLVSMYTFKRSLCWDSSLKLYKNDIIHLEKSAQANALLAYAYINSNPITEKESITNSTLAIEYLNKAVSIYPNFVNWWFDKGKIETSVFDSQEAIKSYERAIAIDSTFSNEVFMLLGLQYEATNMPQMAKKNYLKAIKKEYKISSIYNSLAFLYSQLAEKDNAIFILQEGIRFFPVNYDLHLNLGKLYYSINNNALALVHFKKAQTIDNRDVQLAKVILELELKY